MAKLRTAREVDLLATSAAPVCIDPTILLALSRVGPTEIEAVVSGLGKRLRLPPSAERMIEDATRDADFARRQAGDRLVALTVDLGDELYEDATVPGAEDDTLAAARSLMGLWSEDIPQERWRSALAELYLSSARSRWLIVGHHPRLGKVMPYGLHHALAALARHSRLSNLDPRTIHDAVLAIGIPFFWGGKTMPKEIDAAMRSYLAGNDEAEF